MPKLIQLTQYSRALLRVLPVLDHVRGPRQQGIDVECGDAERKDPATQPAPW